MKTVKRSPEDILDAIEEQELADEGDRVASLSNAEIERELADADIDVKALRAGTQDVLERAMRKRAENLKAHAPVDGAKVVAAKPTATATPIPRAENESGAGTVVALRRRAPRWVLLPLVAAGFATLIALQGSAILATFKDSVDPNEKVTHPNDWTDSAAARALRRDAANALAAQAWGDALELLDRAKELDPRGDEAIEVQDARRIAQQMLNQADAATGRPDREEK